MSRDPRFLNDLFGRSQLPAHLSREGRVRLLGELAEALLAGKQPDRAAALFVGGALIAWLETDRGRLERDFFRVLEPRSHLTVARVWRALRARQNSEGRDS